MALTLKKCSGLRGRLVLAAICLFGAQSAHADVVAGLIAIPAMPLAQSLCGTKRLSLSPDGKFAAAWSPYVFEGKGFSTYSAPDLTVIDTDCVLSRGFDQSCVIAQYGDTAPATSMTWSADSTTLMSSGPGMEFKYFFAPLFQRQTVARVEVPIGDKFGPLRVDAFIGQDAIKAAVSASEKKFSTLSTSDDFSVTDVVASTEPRRQTAVYRQDGSFFAIVAGSSSQTARGISGVSLGDDAQLLHGGREEFILASGTLVRLRDGKEVARGSQTVLSPGTGGVVAVYDNLNSIFERRVSSGTFVQRAIPRRRDELLIDYATTADAKLRAYHFEAPFGPARIELGNAERSKELVCARQAKFNFPVTIEKIDLGQPDWPLPARWFRNAEPKGVVFIALGGPGADASSRDRLFGLERFVKMGLDVVLVTQSGNLGDGKELPDRLAIHGGAALDRDASLIRQALAAPRFAGYARKYFYAESFGALLGLATMQSPGKSGAANFDQYMLAAPWIRPRNPLTWADSRGPFHQNVLIQMRWEKAAMGIDWSKTVDAFRTWAALRADNMSCDAKVAFFYSKRDPTFSPKDVPCEQNGKIVFRALDVGDHNVALAAADPWISETIANDLRIEARPEK